MRVTNRLAEMPRLDPCPAYRRAQAATGDRGPKRASVCPRGRSTHDRREGHEARLSLAVPITPSGLGVQEGVLAALFASIGLAPETAVAGLLLGRLALVLTTGIGVLLLARSAGVPLTIEGPVRHGPVVR